MNNIAFPVMNTFSVMPANCERCTTKYTPIGCLIHIAVLHWILYLQGASVLLFLVSVQTVSIAIYCDLGAYPQQIEAIKHVLLCPFSCPFFAVLSRTLKLCT